MSSAFDASWEEQLWRIRVEQEVFSCQRADVNTLRNELKHLSQVNNYKHFLCHLISSSNYYHNWGLSHWI